MAELGESLSERELDVLQCVVKGASNKEIAAALSISQNTVKVHLRNIFTKLGVSSRTEAVTVALQQGMVSIPGNGATAATATVAEETTDASDFEPGVDIGSSAEATAPVPSTLSPESTATVASPRSLSWRIGGVVLALLLSVIAISLLSVRIAGENIQPTPTPFQEATIDDTRWLVSRAMPVALSSMAVAAVGLDVYQIGGETAEGVTGVVNVYDTREFTWTPRAAKPTPVADTTAAVLFGEVYVPGGRRSDGSPTNIVEVYSPANNGWRPAAALPQPVAGGLALSHGGFLYLFGGWNGREYLDTAYVYNPATDGWRPLPAMPQPRAFAAGGAIAGALYVVGGTDGESELAVCHFFDSVAETWSACPDMLQPRAGAGAAVLFNELYVIGGGMDSTNQVTFSEKYDANTATWGVLNTPMLAETPAWSFLGVTNVETRIYVLGGRHGSSPVADNFVYAPFVYRLYLPAAGNE